MSKKKKKTNQKSKNRRKPKSSKQKQALMRKPNRAQRELMGVYPLLDRKEWDEAQGRLEDLHARYPKSVDVLTELVNLAYDTDDMRTYLQYIRKLATLAPVDGDMVLGLSGAYMANMYPFVAHRYKLEYLRNFPEHERAAEVRESLADDEEILAKVQEDLGVEGDEGYELGYQHDLLRAEMTIGDQETALRIGRQILEKYPTFAPAYNNLSQIEFSEGSRETSLIYARRVLEFEPNNFQASANLARYLYLLGHVEEANAQGEHLESIQSDVWEYWLKMAEAFTYLNNPERVDAAVRGFEANSELRDLFGTGILFHFGAVAALNMGDEKLARSRWRRVKKHDSAYGLARLNLDDLKRSEYKRHGPVAFMDHQWLPKNMFSDLEQIMARCQKSNKSDAETDAQLMQDVGLYLDERPWLMHIFGCLLERGGKEGRAQVFTMANMSEYPPLLEMLQQYGLSKYGPDESRIEAIRIAQQYGHMPSGMLRLWLEGQWVETLSFGFEIGDESEIPFPITNHKAQEAYIESFELIRAGKVRAAMQLLEKAEQLQPDHPIILNNLSLCNERLGELDKAEEILREMVKKNPDYLFGQIAVANQAILDGDLDQAQEILNPLLQRRKLHHNEFSAVSDTQLRILIALDEIEEAEGWLAMWRSVSEDDPKLAEWENTMKLAKTEGMGLMSRTFRKLIAKS